MKKSIVALLAGAEMLAAVSVGLAVGIAPASAAPTQNGVNFFVAQDPANPGHAV